MQLRHWIRPWDSFKKTLVRDTRIIGTDDWASRLEKVTQGQNNNPIEECLEGMPPSKIKNNPELVRVLKEKMSATQI